MIKGQRWQIAPNEGLLPLRFGMSPADVAALDVLGPITARDTDFLGDVSQFHALEEPMMIFRTDIAIHFSANRYVKNVYWGDLPVFEQEAKAMLALMEEANGAPPILQLGTLHFMALNLTTQGFFLDWEDRFYDPARQEQDDRIVSLHMPGTLELMDEEQQQPVTFR